MTSTSKNIKVLGQNESQSLITIMSNNNDLYTFIIT